MASISQFFEKTLHAKLKNIRWSWGAYDPQYNRVILRVWEDQHRSFGGTGECVLLMHDRWVKTRKGYSERIDHIEMLRNGAEGYGVVCRAKDPDSLGNRKIAWFNQEEVLRLGQPFNAEQGIYAPILEKLPPSSLTRRQNTSDQTAVFVNGVFQTVLDEVLVAQQNNPGLTCYLQPHSSMVIKILATQAPSPRSPVPAYFSTSDELNMISYRADIVGWERKQDIPADKLANLNKHIRKYQPKEKSIYLSYHGKTCTNLLSVIGMKKVDPPLAISHLFKVDDGTPLKARSRAGGWSYVYPLPHQSKGIIHKKNAEEDFEKRILESQKLSSSQRRNRLANAPIRPERIQVTSVGFVRNADVVAEVLLRANGICERCKKKAPFLRAKDGTPYLEIHHWIPLCDGGEDTVENAGALCPNCHREVHFGQTD